MVVVRRSRKGKLQYVLQCVVDGDIDDIEFYLQVRRAISDVSKGDEFSEKIKGFTLMDYSHYKLSAEGVKA